MLYFAGPAYIDENVTPKASPIYLGTWYATTLLGPGVGFLIGGYCLTHFTDIELVSFFVVYPANKITYLFYLIPLFSIVIFALKLFKIRFIAKRNAVDTA